MGGGTTGSTWLALTARMRTCRLLAVFTRIQRRAVAVAPKGILSSRSAHPLTIDAYGDQSRANSFDSLN